MGIYDEDFLSHKKNTVRVWVFEDFFDLDAVQVYVPCKNLRILRNSTLVSIWYLHGIDPNNLVGKQRSQILSCSDTHLVSIFDGYYNLDTGRVGSLIPLLIPIVY